MSEITANQEATRIMTDAQVSELRDRVFTAARTKETWSEKVNANLGAAQAFVDRGIDLIQRFERAAIPHPTVHEDTDVIYIDSGPGEYSKKDSRLRYPKSSFQTDDAGNEVYRDTNYHKFPWSREMDRDRLRAAVALARMVTAKRVEQTTGVTKSTKDLTTEDFKKYGPTLLYSGAEYQNPHIAHVKDVFQQAGLLEIPDSKIKIYNSFTDRNGEVRKIIHTEDQIEGLQLPPNPDGQPPRRLVIVSHSAHLMRIVHVLGKYPNSIPDATTLQLYPIPTRTGDNGVMEYAETELLGTMATVFRKNRATLEPYTNYSV